MVAFEISRSSKRQLHFPTPHLTLITTELLADLQPMPLSRLMTEEMLRMRFATEMGMTSLAVACDVSSVAQEMSEEETEIETETPGVGEAEVVERSSG